MEENQHEPDDNNCNILYKARPSLGLMDELKNNYLSHHYLAANDAVTEFERKLHLKQYMENLQN
jgi:hypothetical protein